MGAKPGRGKTVWQVVGVIFALFVLARVTGILGTCGLPGCGTLGESPVYQDSDLAKTDPKLVTWQELKQITLATQKPRALAVGPDGRLYVANKGNVGVFSVPDGGQKAAFGVKGDPTCLAVGPDNRVYVGYEDHIEVYSDQWLLTQVWPSLGDKAYITSICVGKDTLWAGDAGNRVIVNCDLSGRVLALVGKKDASKGAPGIIAPSPHLDVALAKDGGVWAVNPGRHEFELYAPDGAVKKTWGKASFAIDGFSGCCNPTDFAILPDGRFVTSEKGIPRVKVYSADGKFEGVVAGFESFRQDVVGLDLACDKMGRVYVLDPASGAVRIFIPKGKSGK